ncbi:hypothetical protein BLOT_011556 [Blomia tropicalis]|nr:hypothetical protein BLOT_011556 [Blomia tropicalis]
MYYKLESSTKPDDDDDDGDDEEEKTLVKIFEPKLNEKKDCGQTYIPLEHELKYAARDCRTIEWASNKH